jgi:hypothetical protein
MTPDEASTLCGETKAADSTAAGRPTMKILQQAKPASATATDAVVQELRPESPVGRTEAIGS